MIPGGPKKVLTYIFSERTVELQAWRVHGGPEAFEAQCVWILLCATPRPSHRPVFPSSLQKLRNTHQMKFPQKRFKCPAAYDSIEPSNAAVSPSTSTSPT